MLSLFMLLISLVMEKYYKFKHSQLNIHTQTQSQPKSTSSNINTSNNLIFTVEKWFNLFKSKHPEIKFCK